MGVVAALGVAFSAAGTALAYFLGLFKGIPAWKFPLFAIGLMLLISGPSMLIAWLKLRKRNLGPILDANGWAVNAKAKVNVPFGTSLTGIAKLPPGSSVDVSDRYAEKSSILPENHYCAVFRVVDITPTSTKRAGSTVGPTDNTA